MNTLFDKLIHFENSLTTISNTITKEAPIYKATKRMLYDIISIEC